MAIHNQIPMADILSRKLPSLTSSKQAVSSGKTNQPLNAVFNRLLTSFRAGSSGLKGSRPTGLTAVDYLARPLPAHENHKSKSKHTPAVDQNQVTADNCKRSNRVKRDQTGVSSLSQENAVAAKTRIRKPVQQPKNMSENEWIEKCVKKAAQKYKLPANLIKGVIKAESNFAADVISSAGAQGLMQLMPGTAKELGVSDPFDIEQNIDGGSHYLRKMLDKFDGNVRIALAAYNAGPGAVQKYDGNVPYEETKQYVKRVLRFSQRYA
jgi:hypothetical protein